MNKSLNSKPDLKNSNTKLLNNIGFSDIFNLEDIQRMQDMFADATGVASLITHPDGTPITNPSNFCRLCNNIIRKTEKGRANCYKSDASVGRQNPSGPVVQPCLSGGLWDAGASITVGGKHIANWLIGQIRNKEVDEQRMIQYADEIGANRDDFMEALAEVPVMSVEQFTKVSKMLFVFANKLSEKTYENLKLKESEAKFHAIFMNMAEGAALHELTYNDHGVPEDYVIIEVNAAFEIQLGLSTQNVIGKTSREVYNVADPPYLEIYARVATTGEPFVFETYFPPLKNHFSISAYRPSKGSFATIFEDITERKQSVDVLRETNSYLENLINYANAPIIVWNPQFRITRFNHAFETLSGRSEAEVIGQSLEILFPPALAENSMRLIRNTLTGERWETVEIEILHKSGLISIVLWNSATVFAPDGQTPVATIAQGQDITLRKHAEEALSQSSTRLKLATLAGGVGVWEWDVVNNVMLWDDQMFALYGIAKENFGGGYEAWLAGVHPEDMAQAEAESMMAVNGKNEYNTEFRVVWPDGSVHNIRAQAVVHRYDTGKSIRMIGTNWDITEQKKSEAVLLKARQEAEMANKSKSIFLANMSHEIRTPLNAIIGFSQLMNRDKSLSDTQKEYNTSVIRAGEHLLVLLNDILELSKIEAGRIVSNPTNVDLSVIFKDLQLIFSEKAHSKHLKFIFETVGKLPRFVVIDESKLRQIFINLIGNAIKFTDEGSITVRTRFDKKTDGAGHLIVEIEDTGSGIAEGELIMLFKHFVQTSAGIKKGSGTGLGLALSQELAILMGGKISVSSKVGKGSVFTFYVEIKEGAIEAVDHNIAKRVIGIDKDQKTYRILIVDDNKENLKLVVDLLKLVGFETNGDVNGEDAIAKFEEWPPDLILMDMRMPVMDGYEATRRIKLLENGAQTPVIVMTANIFEGEINRIETMGIQGYICKPFRENDLFDTIGKVLGIKFIYEDETYTSQTKYFYDDEVIAANILRLSASLVLQMQNAVAVADINRLKKLITSIDADNSQLAQHLMTMAKNYDYNRLQKLLTTNI